YRLSPPPSRLSLSSSDVTATPRLYALSLHDALPIFTADVTQERRRAGLLLGGHLAHGAQQRPRERHDELVTTGEAVRVINSLESDRKSTRLNSSHVKISYAVFCLKKKKKK